MKSKIVCLVLNKAIWFCIFLSTNAWGTILDSLRLVPQQTQENFVVGFYNRNLRYNKDSVYVIGQLKSLLDYTQKTSSRGLECVSYSLLADHYARMRQYNTLSDELHQKAIAKAKEYDLPLNTGMALYKAGRFYYNIKNKNYVI